MYFDHFQVRFTRGQLKEESHYYPFGLPMGDMGSAAAGFTPNRSKYQSNEYIKDAGLNWMNFNNRQYDPQTGRFLSADPLAAAGGQDSYSPYAAMGSDPVGSTDPDGLMRNQTPRLKVSVVYRHDVYPFAGFFPSSLNWIGVGGHIDLRDYYDQLFGPGWTNAGSTGSVITLTGEAARAVMSLLTGSSSFHMQSSGLIINFKDGSKVSISFDGKTNYTAPATESSNTGMLLAYGSESTGFIRVAGTYVQDAKRMNESR